MLLRLAVMQGVWAFSLLDLIQDPINPQKQLPLGIHPSPQTQPYLRRFYGETLPPGTEEPSSVIEICNKRLSTSRFDSVMGYLWACNIR